jgi:hypothetical protein
MKNRLDYLRGKYFNSSTLEISKFWKLLSALMLILSFTNLSAQTGQGQNNVLNILEVDKVPGIKGLINDMRPSIYLKQADLKKFGTGQPDVAFCDAASVNMLYGGNPDFNNVQLITFKINSSGEKNLNIDLSRLESFSNLKYLFIVFTYDECGGQSDVCLENIARGMVTGTRSGISIVYQLSIPN